MATEAQRLIGISLAKIAQSRIRGGVSLHKNLLVATVLQKARYIFMEEAYHMVHGHYIQTNRLMEEKLKQQQQEEEGEAENSKNKIIDHNHQQQLQHQHINDHNSLDDLVHNNNNNNNNSNNDSDGVNSRKYCDNKENNPPSVSNLIYFDMDSTKLEQKMSQDNSIHANRIMSTTLSLNKNSPSLGGIKRRREITEWETEEAVLSILPKRIKSEDDDDDGSDDANNSNPSYLFCDESDEADNDSIYNDDDGVDDDDESVFYDDSTTSKIPEYKVTETDLLTTISSTTLSVPSINNSSNNNQGIDRITSLVSIFSFGNLSRTLSPPDLCSAQAQDSEKLSQRTYLAMTV